ncbi:hypothetical protein [Streptomyces similanensis]
MATPALSPWSGAAVLGALRPLLAEDPAHDWPPQGPGAGVPSAFRSNA